MEKQLKQSSRTQSQPKSQPHPKLILGIETSCDETAASVIEDGRIIRSNLISSQINLHARFGGVVPEIASRRHLEIINPLIDTALKEAGVGFEDLTALAVSYGPGLVGALLVGVATAKSLAYAHGLPLVPVNHLKGHIYAAFLRVADNPAGETGETGETGGAGSDPGAGDASAAGAGRGRDAAGAIDAVGIVSTGETGDAGGTGGTGGTGGEVSHGIPGSKGNTGETDEDAVKFPLLGLIASGGHTDLVWMPCEDETTVIGHTRDDAAGEAFDKVARALKLGYPGGPVIDKLSREGNPESVPLPRAYLKEENSRFDFSFSGLKSAVLNYLHQKEQKGETVDIPGLAASFQAAVVEVLVNKTIAAVIEKKPATLVLCGGVAANTSLRRTMRERLAKTAPGVRFRCPPPALCTDNAAMIAAAAFPCLERGRIAPLDLNAVPNLTLHQNPPLF